jgi:iron complex transport system ATP-binding protein
MKLTIENAGFSHKKGVPVIQNLNFSAQSGEVIAILGPNGAGKTTLLRCMMGFLHWDTGKSMLDGENIREISPKRLWRRVSYVPQAKGVSSALTGREMILLGCTNRIGVFSAPGKKEKNQVEELADKLGITALLDKKCSEISGGELQMILIARALAAKPELLILDEPESNLDFKNQLIVLETISKLAAEGICCIFNTHYPTHALLHATKSLILHKGGASIFGDTATVLTEENIQSAFGVEAVIGEIETPGNVYRSVLPLKIAKKGEQSEPKTINPRTIAVISIIFKNFDLGEKINELLHEYSHCMVGRMGMPYLEAGVYIINVTVDAPQSEVQLLLHKLSILPGVHAKATCADVE